MEFNTKVVDSSKNTSSEGISRVHSNKSHNSNGPKSNNHSAANSIYNQQAHQPKFEKLVSGTVFYVGNHVVEIVNYLAEGGFSQIYKCKFIKYANDSIINGESLNVDDYVCLKRVICQNQQSLNELQLEVEVMKRFQNCDRIVKFYDSMAKKKSAFDGSELQDDVHGVFDPNTYYEVFVLMELCSNNSLLEFMNERLQTKLSETEILNIMYDTTKALFHMHSAGLIHKDIKIENVLVDKDWHFKLCDFGSTSKPYPIVSSPQDLAYLSQDIYVHTTPQYRSPEMIDLYKSLPIDEKSDIWALGIFLYKLLFYTTPFEMTGTFAALHSRYDIPVNNYSTKITNLIVIMLSENPSLRPNIYQVFMEIHVLLKGPNHPLPIGIADIYQNGPYNFNKFSSYQTFVHNLQINLANSYQQKKQIDEYMYVNVFDIASKQPYNTGTYYANGKSQEQPQYQSNSNSVTAEGLNNTTQHVPDASRSRSNGERLFNVSKEAKKDSFSDVHVDDVKRHSFTGKDDSASTTHLEDEEDVTKRFPSVDDLAMELDNIADNELKKTETSKSSGSSKGYTSYETLDKNTPITTQNSSSASKSIVEIPTPTKTNFGQSIATQQKETVPAKKYKSNNPFPKINTSVAQDSYKNKGFPVKEDFFAYPSSPVQKNFTNQTVEKENDAKNNNPYLNNYSAGNTKTGSSLTNASIHNNSGSQPISPFMGAAQANVPAQTLNRIDEHNYTNRSNTYQNGSTVGNPEKAAIESKTTKDLIDFSDLKIDVNDSMKKTVLKNKLNDAGELKRKMKEESPIMSEDSSFNDLPGEESNYSTEIDKSVRDPRIKNVLQLRYSEVDTDDVDELPDQQRGKKSLDFRREIFTEDMDLNGSTESLTPTPDVEYRKKNGLLSSHHRHNSANNGTSGQKSILNDEAINDRRTRRSLEFEREVMKASSKRGSDAKEDDYELANGKDKKSVISNTAKEVENVSRSGSMTKQEKRKSLFGKFTKGF